ncbi:hypothetical protein [Lactococcus lactis]|uniref:hypothetical protein n=1 Tax=Lactococcus lactis TaxID=1358 RepID=UPI0019D715DC|nr:hypothetical protein [Lactococcus lactis]
MKLSEIEEVGYLLTAYDEEDVYDDDDINYDVFEFHRDNYTQNDLNRCGLTQWDFCDCQALYTAEQMQEYAKANCWELINWYVETTGDVNHAAEMKIWMDDEFGGHEK